MRCRDQLCEDTLRMSPHLGWLTEGDLHRLGVQILSVQERKTRQNKEGTQFLDLEVTEDTWEDVWSR